MKRAALTAFLATLAAGLAGAEPAVPDVVPGAGQSREWHFRVLLDGNEVGYHEFRLTGDGRRLRLTTEADLRVRFLFLTAYRYEHVNSETWLGECLVEIDARTDDNGKVSTVQGRADHGRFELADGALPGARCVKSFAYWNPAILDASALLNSQTGELTPVDVEEVARETLPVRGKAVEATRYRIKAPGLAIDLWYSDDREWLGLESTLKGGRTLRYELT